MNLIPGKKYILITSSNSRPYCCYFAYTTDQVFPCAIFVLRQNLIAQNINELYPVILKHYKIRVYEITPLTEALFCPQDYTISNIHRSNTKMQNFLSKLKVFGNNLMVPLIALGAFAVALFGVLRLFSSKKIVEDEFPQKQKNELKKEVKSLEKEAKNIEKKKYSDEELDKVFNGSDND